MVKRKTKKRTGRKPGPKKGSKNKKQKGGALGLAASVLTPIAIEIIGTSISKKKPVSKVMRDYFK